MRLIDADVLVCKLVSVKQDYAEESNDLYEKTVNCLIKILQKETICPTVDAEPVRHGRWICPDYDFSDYWKCSACNEEFYFECDPLKDYEYHYCPNCGAKMDGGAEDN